MTAYVALLLRLMSCKILTPMDNEHNDKQKEMDTEAIRARQELEQNFENWRARDLATWWSRWYLKAGHKRLGRTLVDIAKKSR